MSSMELGFLEGLVLILLGYSLGVRTRNGREEQGTGSKREPRSG